MFQLNDILLVAKLSPNKFYQLKVKKCEKPRDFRTKYKTEKTRGEFTFRTWRTINRLNVFVENDVELCQGEFFRS